MKPYLSTMTVEESTTREVPPCSFIEFYSVTGSVALRLGASDAVPVRTGKVYQLPIPMMFEKIFVITEAGAEAVVNFGIAQSGGGGGGAGLITSGAPTTAEAAGTTAYDPGTGTFYVNGDGTSTGWVVLIA